MLPPLLGVMLPENRAAARMTAQIEPPCEPATPVDDDAPVKAPPNCPVPIGVAAEWVEGMPMVLPMPLLLPPRGEIPSCASPSPMNSRQGRLLDPVPLMRRSQMQTRGADPPWHHKTTNPTTTISRTRTQRRRRHNHKSNRWPHNKPVTASNHQGGPHRSRSKDVSIPSHPRQRRDWVLVATKDLQQRCCLSCNVPNEHVAVRSRGNPFRKRHVPATLERVDVPATLVENSMECERRLVQAHHVQALRVRCDCHLPCAVHREHTALDRERLLIPALPERNVRSITVSGSRCHEELTD